MKTGQRIERNQQFLSVLSISHHMVTYGTAIWMCTYQWHGKQFRMQKIRELIQNANAADIEVQLSHLEAHKVGHWSVKGTKRRCVMCTMRKRGQPAYTLVKSVVSHFVWLHILRTVTRKQTFRSVEQ
jgi:hypothetical protein